MDCCGMTFLNCFQPIVEIPATVKNSCIKRSGCWRFRRKLTLKKRVIATRGRRSWGTMEDANLSVKQALSRLTY
jgi:hypothetical protein